MNETIASVGPPPRGRPLIHGLAQGPVPTIIPIQILRHWFQKGFVVPLIKKIEFTGDPWFAYLQLPSSPYSFFLDSVRRQPGASTLSYAGTAPFLVVRRKDGQFEFERNGKVTRQSGDFLDQLRGLFRRYRGRTWPGLPDFTGGAVGYLSYDLAWEFERLPHHAKNDLRVDKACLLFVQNLVAFDLSKKEAFLIANLIPEFRKSFEQSLQEAEGWIETISAVIAGWEQNHLDVGAQLIAPKFKGVMSATRPVGSVQNRLVDGSAAIFGGNHAPTLLTASRNDGFSIQNFRADIKKSHFKKMIGCAKRYIEAGDIYQANLSQRFSFCFSGRPETLYHNLRRINPSPFSSFLRLGEHAIVSSSPERLIKKRGEHCQTRPIAGTRPRGKTDRENRKLRRDLMASEKERAEHVMLVDLERNDLGRVCRPHSVRVSEMMTLEEYSHVVHIVSNVEGKLKKGADQFDLIKAMFPGGTITGCPKIRCMEIIEELEPFKRGVYTGSAGYFGFNGDLDLNIIIRTILLKQNRGYFQVGAGIVHDSDPEAEYWETLHKGKALVDALSS